MRRFTINLQFVIIEFIFLWPSTSNFHIKPNKLSSTRSWCATFFCITNEKVWPQGSRDRKILLLLLAREWVSNLTREEGWKSEKKKNNFRKLNLLWKVCLHNHRRKKVEEHLVFFSKWERNYCGKNLFCVERFLCIAIRTFSWLNSHFTVA